MKNLEYVTLAGNTPAEARQALILPNWPGQILWYIHELTLYTARVYEIKFTSADRGSVVEDFIAFAWNPKAQRQLTWCPLHEEGWLDARDEYVPVFTDRGKAIKAITAMRAKEEEKKVGVDHDVDVSADRGDQHGGGLGRGSGAVCDSGLYGDVCRFL